MSQQKALLLTEKQGPFEIGLVDKPTPGPGEILVKIIATALNPVDWKIQAHASPFIESYPVVLGSDSAGIVEQVGEGVAKFKVGDKVFHQGYFVNRNATFQQYTIVPAEIAAHIPENVTFEEAASVPLGLATSAAGLYNPVGGKFIYKSLRPQELDGTHTHTDPIEAGSGLGLTAPWEGGEGKYSDQGILILGGASSVGQYTIQLAKLSGFKPIVTTASLHNTELLKSLGATHVIDRKADVVAEAAKIFTTPPSIVYDAISLTSTQQAGWKILGSNGALILVLPPAEGIEKEVDGKSVINVLGNVFVQRQLGVSMYAHLTEYMAAGKIKSNKVEVLPNGLAGIVDGLKRLQNDQVSGFKLIAKPQEAL